MSYAIEPLNDCTLKFSFHFKGEEVNLSGKIYQAAKVKQREVNIKGFRKGKVPIPIIQKTYRGELTMDAIRDFMNEKFSEATEKENLHVFNASITEGPSPEDLDSDFRFYILAEVYPQFELKDFRELTFHKDKVEIHSQDIEEAKKAYLESKAVMQNLEGEDCQASMEHFVVINFQGEREDGSRPEDLKGEEYLIKMEADHLMPGMKEGLLGMKRGEKKIIPATFPEDYHDQEVRNIKVNFHVELLEIKEKQFPEFDEKLAQELGYKSVEDFEIKNKEILIKKKERESNLKLNREIIKKLVEENPFDIPYTLLLKQEDYVYREIKEELKQQGLRPNKIEESLAHRKNEIKRASEVQVRTSFIFDKLMKKYRVEEAVEANFDDKLHKLGVKKDKTDEIRNEIFDAICKDKLFAHLYQALDITTS